ncbi:glycosyl hydrolase family 8 [Mesobacillus maritimus]|uniref:glycosyl hydrolase family 8 n=1 Tax=Mesobacillus maritimus TaxID=1643336 RepID=UPI00203D369D|nr:glycosyl hydrolase family 8 [Mesobacillus maritimus]MCM3669761.1 glycosyl hydrolase family 8 [Mesobacillus maritimus]
MKKHYRYVGMFVVILLISVLGGYMYREAYSKFPTETFIKRHMVNQNGTLATYLKESNQADSDFVQGREALSETVGIWMQYALAKEDRLLFEESYEILTNYFLQPDGLVYWKLDSSGDVHVSTNAAVDDLRVIVALYKASDLWGSESYLKTAKVIEDYLVSQNDLDGYLTDFYDSKLKVTSDRVTISYIDSVALTTMVKKNAINVELYRSMIGLLIEVPVQNGFYAKSYHVPTKQYHFDEEINMIDQVLVALHLANIGVDTDEFLHFLKEEFKQDGRIYGRYHLETRTPTVNYESPALYGFAILYCLEVGENEFAQALYKRMTKFRVGNWFSTYYGAYSISQNQDTHIFDSVVPMLAEQIMYQSGYIK